jgi:hypothetical protein
MESTLLLLSFGYLSGGRELRLRRFGNETAMALYVWRSFRHMEPGSEIPPRGLAFRRK